MGKPPKWNQLPIYGRERGGRRGEKKLYNDVDVEQLLGFIEDVLPLVIIDWSIVFMRSNGDGKIRRRAHRYFENLKTKF